MDFQNNENSSLQGNEGAKQESKPVQAVVKALETPKKKKIDVKPALNLDETIKIVEELHRKKEKRNLLANTLLKLDNFVINYEREDDLEDTNSNYFTGCILTIKDENRKEFATKNPVLIAEIVDFLKEKTLAKITEVEAEIVINL
ncbi:hypothetical protein KHS38_11790 [Mucilaginibacter sp. Bleaf8]|uniref:hypothetical protein n=1 Tax=Mucilaginibacter sp. Bleaf8 TaxID=2834430 RepID=UPI001BCCD5DD|nr:hypothetical protein [Mucilaginibacter sp. Bleaf8]MBS7565087.1 hypothetical protein [Mucilaginibacter sp. Bleaf8]